MFLNRKQALREFLTYRDGFGAVSPRHPREGARPSADPSGGERRHSEALGAAVLVAAVPRKAGRHHHKASFSSLKIVGFLILNE